MTDQQCLDNIRLGGKARDRAMDELYKRYAKHFLSYLLKHRVVRQIAEEMVQDIFIKILNHCDSFRGETRIDAWMWSIVRNTLIDYTRRNNPEEATDDDVLIYHADEQQIKAAEASRGQQDSDPDAVVECITRALAAFSVHNYDRAFVLSLVTLKEWATEDVATMIKRTPGATRQYLSECRKKFKPFAEPCLKLLAG